MTESDRAKPDLARLRTEIETIDRTLVKLIADRVNLARAIGFQKRGAGLPTLDPAREAAIIRRASRLAREAGLGEEDVREIFWHIVGLCRRAQLEPLPQDERD